MSEHTLTIIKNSGETFTIASNQNMRVLSFSPESPTYDVPYQTIEGRDGEIATEGRFTGRKIPVRIFFRSYDIQDFYLFRNQIFRLFNSREAFYMISSREPGKRWLVRVDGTYEIKPEAGKYGIFDIVFKSESTYAESIGTTQDNFTFDSGLWQIGQGLLSDESSQQYTFTTPSFSVYNAGDNDVDPRGASLLITFKGASSNLKIENVTTGDVWQYTGDTVDSDVIVLDGVKSLKNGVSIFKDTNYMLITIAPGWNDFVISGASGAFTIDFNFRYLYF